jgi:hypothetical protein
MKRSLRTGLAFIALLAVAPAQAADLGARVQPPALLRLTTGRASMPV